MIAGFILEEMLTHDTQITEFHRQEFTILSIFYFTNTTPAIMVIFCESLEIRA